MVKCTKCNISKPTTAFRPRKGSSTGCQYWCRDCENEANRKRYVPKPKRVKKVLDTKEKRLERMLKHRYSITPQEYDRMYDEQGGRCAICNEERPKGGRFGLYVDHCHNSNKVRGLLCTNCNTGIGKLKESESLLMAAIEYIKKYNVHGTRTS